MKQVVNIKKVAVDSELKVTIQLEFIAANAQSKENVFSLIALQGDVAEVTVIKAQKELFGKSAHGNGDGPEPAAPVLN